MGAYERSKTYGTSSPETFKAKLRWVAEEPLNTMAYRAVALAYAHGFGTGVDKKRAFEYAKRGVEVDKKEYGEYALQGCAEILAQLYHTGAGTEKNDTLALDLLRHCHQTPWVINFIKEITG